MKVSNVPVVDAGYWAAIVAASMCGTNAGDLAAGPLGLGHLWGILPIALAAILVLGAETVVNWTSVAFYWVTIILLRTMATNIADFATHDAGLSYRIFVSLLIVLMVAIICSTRYKGHRSRNPVGSPQLPPTDASYWALMLVAGVLGTALGDWLADIGLGFDGASLLGAPAFAAAIWAAHRSGLTKTWYWIAVVICRTWGTDLGDALVLMFQRVGSRSSALWVSTALTAALLAAVIYFWTHRSSKPSQRVADHGGPS